MNASDTTKWVTAFVHSPWAMGYAVLVVGLIGLMVWIWKVRRRTGATWRRRGLSAGMVLLGAVVSVSAVAAYGHTRFQRMVDWVDSKQDDPTAISADVMAR